MKRSFYLLLALSLVITLPLAAQDENSKSPVPDFHTPKEWRGETLTLPPGFASDLKWNGIEHIRFAPGMFKPESESFFSYVLVFLLNKDSDVSRENLHAQILTYYRGLSKAVMGKKGADVKFEDFTFKLDEEEDESGVLSGVLNWVEPFATKKKQTLNIEISQWTYKGGAVLYFVVSPQKKDHAIWKEMRKYRDAFELSGMVLSKGK